MLLDFKVYAVLPSHDLSAARTWYEAKTGAVPAYEDPGGLWYECADGTGFLVTASEYAGTAENTAASFHVSHIEDLMSELRGRGIVFEDYDLPDFKTEDGLMAMGRYKAAWFKDGDGNIIEVTEVVE